jgi:hypothetical protein
MNPLDYWLTRRATPPQPEDPATTAGCVAGELAVAAALGLGAEWFHDAREHAITLYGEGRWEACVAIVRGLVALGNESPVDPILLERCQARLDAGV